MLGLDDELVGAGFRDQNRAGPVGCEFLSLQLFEIGIVFGIEIQREGGIDALKDFSRKEIRGKTIVAVVSGGNFDFERLPDVKERALRFEGLKKYFIIRFPQRPGALRDALGLDGAGRRDGTIDR